MNKALMIKIAEKTSKTTSGVGFAGGLALSALRPTIHHLSSGIAKGSNNPPDDESLGERASAAYKKKRNRSMAGSVIGAGVGALAHRALATKRTGLEDSFTASALGGLIGGKLGEKTLSKKDGDDIAKYKFHEDLNHKFKIKDDWMNYKGRGMDSDPKHVNDLDLEISMKDPKKGRNFSANLVKGKNFDRINQEYKRTGAWD